MPPKRKTASGVAAVTRLLKRGRPSRAPEPAASGVIAATPQPKKGIPSRAPVPAASALASSNLSTEAETRIVDQVTERIAASLPAIIAQSLGAAGVTTPLPTASALPPAVASVCAAAVDSTFQTTVNQAMDPILGESDPVPHAPLYSHAMPVG